MEALATIKKSLSQESHRIEENLEKEELIVNDESLDLALEFTGSINRINEGFLNIFNGLDTLSGIIPQSEQDKTDIREILAELKEMNRKSIALWIDFNNHEFLKVACKSALLDLRTNIRSLKEYIEDTHNLFFLQDQHREDLDNLFSSL